MVAQIYEMTFSAPSTERNSSSIHSLNRIESLIELCFECREDVLIAVWLQFKGRDRWRYQGDSSPPVRHNSLNTAMQSP